MFKPALFTMKDGIRQSLSDNGIVLINNALQPETADALHDELRNASVWGHQVLHENRGTDREFIYSRSSIKFGSGNETPLLRDLHSCLMGDEFRGFISYVSGLACQWFEGAAAILEPGDAIGVHNDNTNTLRTVGFNLYLNRDWRAEYGGEFVMMDPYLEIAPAFNLLSLFIITPTSHHKVNQVSPDAPVGRLAISGWFHWVKPGNT